MLQKIAVSTAIVLLTAGPSIAQQTVPLYNVTVIEHNLQAVNYQYRSGPTEVDFRGTVLLPRAKGHATVESRRGRTDIDAKLQGLTSRQAFGHEYLTYVLWAISPEGAPHNLGEIVSNGSDDAHVHVTTELQAFGLLVTAEPYAAVRQPGDVVVLENQVRPETIGKIEPIQVKAELLPRGHYVLDKQSSQTALASDAPKVSMGEYEQLSQIYQAENALALARTVEADKLAPDTYAKARQLLDEAKQRKASKAGTSFVVQSAREAAQTADDARVIALKRRQDQKLASAEQQLADAQRAKAQAEMEAQQARADSDAARAALEQAQNHPAAPVPALQQTPRPLTAPPDTAPPSPIRRQAQNLACPQTQLRMRLLSQLKGIAETRDTPRGLLVTIPDTDFSGGLLLESSVLAVDRVAQAIAPLGLHVAVEGHTDSASTEALSSRRAEAVRDAMTTRGVPAASITARGYGNSKPFTSNATEAGRTQNRRVEIVISGGQIGDTPLWDNSYSLTPR